MGKGRKEVKLGLSQAYDIFWAFDRHKLQQCPVAEFYVVIGWLLSKRDLINSNIHQTQNVAWIWNTALLLLPLLAVLLTGSSITG